MFDGRHYFLFHRHAAHKMMKHIPDVVYSDEEPPSFYNYWKYKIPKMLLSVLLVIDILSDPVNNELWLLSTVRLFRGGGFGGWVVIMGGQLVNFVILVEYTWISWCQIDLHVFVLVLYLHVNGKHGKLKTHYECFTHVCVTLWYEVMCQNLTLEIEIP